MRQRTRTNQRPQLAACAFEVRASGDEVHLLPAGEFRAQDGRPFDADAWRLDATIAAGVIARLAERESAVVIDYEHQTLHTEINGQPAPAAGWFRTAEYREGEGLVATDVTWTERARRMIGDGEYRYISPVFSYLPETGEVLQILHAGLTNVPALDGLPELAVQAAARLSHDDHDQEEATVDEELLKLLGLDADAGAEKAREAVAALKDKAEEAEKKDEQIAALKAKSPEPDPSQYAPISVVNELRTEIAALKTNQTEREVDELVRAGLDDGRLLPAQEEWARSLGKHNVAQLRAYLETAEPIAALKGSQTGGKPPAGGGDDEGLTDAQKAICRQMGVSEEEYLKTQIEEG